MLTLVTNQETTAKSHHFYHCRCSVELNKYAQISKWREKLKEIKSKFGAKFYKLMFQHCKLLSTGAAVGETSY